MEGKQSPHSGAGQLQMLIHRDVKMIKKAV